MPSAFIITNGGLDPISVNNYASIFSTEEEAIRYAALMRINIKHNFYMIDIPEPERPINVLITHYYPSKKKTVLCVSSQEEAHVIASSYYKQQYDEYLATQEKTKSWDYEHMKIACNMTFRPDCTMLQMSGTFMQNAFVCFSNLKLGN